MMRIRITVHGAIYTALGVLLFISGLLRGELLSTSCGGLLTLYAGFAATVSGLTAFYWRHEESEIDICDESSADDTEIAADIKGGSCFIVKPCNSGCPSLAATNKTFPFCAVGTAAFYTIVFSGIPHPTAKAVFTVTIPLQKQRTVYHVKQLPRGRYFYKQQYLCIRDIAGFFSVSFKQPLTSHTYISAPKMLPLEKSTAVALRSSALQEVPQARTVELYESRPYFPGDDPRKIHWKLYAHTGNLSIKLGAFEPPPVKRFTIYIEEPFLLKEKERALLTPVLDAFIGRIFFLILQLINAGFQCSILLNDYPHASVQENETANAVKTNSKAETKPKATALQSMPRKSLRRYDILPEASAAFSQLQNILAVPALCSMPEDLPDAAAVFNAVPQNGGLLYCYIPRPNVRDGSNTHGTGSGSTTDTNAKITASRRTGIHAFFYPATPPHEPPLSLLYSSSASVRRAAFYRNLLQAAEQDLHTFAVGNCYAELL